MPQDQAPETEPQDTPVDPQMQPPPPDAAESIDPLSATQKTVLAEWLQDPFRASADVLHAAFPELNPNQRRRRVGTIFNDVFKAFVRDLLKPLRSLDAESSFEPPEHISDRDKNDVIDLCNRNIDICQQNLEALEQQRRETGKEKTVEVTHWMRFMDTNLKTLSRLQGFDKADDTDKTIPAFLAIQRCVTEEEWLHQHGIEAVEEVAGEIVPYTHDTAHHRLAAGRGLGFDSDQPVAPLITHTAGKITEIATKLRAHLTDKEAMKDERVWGEAIHQMLNDIVSRASAIAQYQEVPPKQTPAAAEGTPPKVQ